MGSGKLITASADKRFGSQLVGGATLPFGARLLGKENVKEYEVGRQQHKAQVAAPGAHHVNKGEACAIGGAGNCQSAEQDRCVAGGGGLTGEQKRLPGEQDDQSEAGLGHPP